VAHATIQEHRGISLDAGLGWRGRPLHGHENLAQHARRTPIIDSFYDDEAPADTLTSQ
jgi:hypothetical protein